MLPGPQQPGDELTKMACNLAVTKVLETCQFSLVESEECRVERERVRGVNRDRKAAARDAAEAESALGTREPVATS